MLTHTEWLERTNLEKKQERHKNWKGSNQLYEQAEGRNRTGEREGTGEEEEQIGRKTIAPTGSCN